MPRAEVAWRKASTLLILQKNSMGSGGKQGKKSGRIFFMPLKLAYQPFDHALLCPIQHGLTAAYIT